MANLSQDEERIAQLLRKHGLAASTMSAENMAKEISGNKMPSQRYNEMERAKMEQPPQRAQGLTEEQIVTVLQKFTDMFSKEIDKLTQRLNNAERQLEKLQEGGVQVVQESASNMQMPSQNAQQMLSSQAQAAPNPNAPVMQFKQPEKKEPPKPNQHPRSAAFDANKYSVEKFFYSGGR